VAAGKEPQEDPAVSSFLAGLGALPPFALKVTATVFLGTGFHLAYTAMFAVTGVLAVKAVPVPSALVFQPSKVKSCLVGGVGKVILLL
jgi:hypothetical protein